MTHGRFCLMKKCLRYNEYIMSSPVDRQFSSNPFLVCLLWFCMWKVMGQRSRPPLWWLPRRPPLGGWSWWWPVCYFHSRRKEVHFWVFKREKNELFRKMGFDCCVNMMLNLFSSFFYSEKMCLVILLIWPKVNYVEVIANSKRHRCENHPGSFLSLYLMWESLPLKMIKFDMYI